MVSRNEISESELLRNQNKKSEENSFLVEQGLKLRENVEEMKSEFEKISKYQLDDDKFLPIENISDIPFKLNQNQAINDFIYSLNANQLQLDPIIESDELSWIRHSWDDLITVDLKTFKFSKNRINVPRHDNSVNLRGSVIIPGDQVFFYGGYYTDEDGIFFSVGEAFTIDKSQQITHCPVWKPTSCITSLAYYDNFVYAFGGADETIWEKYDLKRKVWSSCARIPEGDYRGSCSASCNNHIFILSKYVSKLLIYDILQDIYEQAPSLTLTPEISKNVVTANNRVYVIEFQRNIYQNGVNDFNAWEAVGINNLCDWNSPCSSVARLGDRLYFIQFYAKLIEFNLRDKTVRQVIDIESSIDNL